MTVRRDPHRGRREPERPRHFAYDQDGDGTQDLGAGPAVCGSTPEPVEVEPGIGYTACPWAAGIECPGSSSDAGTVKGAISLAFSGATDDVPRMRRFVARWLQQGDVPEPERSDLLLAVAEAINNACQHPAPPGCAIQISCSRDGHRISISVSDEGRGFSVDPEVTRHEPALDKTQGRGLFLMRYLTDEVTIKTTTRGTTVTLVREVTPERV